MATHRDAAGVPRVPPEFVAEQGQLVRILDVRDEAELSARSATSPRSRTCRWPELGEVPRTLEPETCVVVVSNRGGRAGIAARVPRGARHEARRRDGRRHGRVEAARLHDAARPELVSQGARSRSRPASAAMAGRSSPSRRAPSSPRADRRSTSATRRSVRWVKLARVPAARQAQLRRRSRRPRRDRHARRRRRRAAARARGRRAGHRARAAPPAEVEQRAARTTSTRSAASTCTATSAR